MITPGLVHLGAAVIALVTGLLLFASRKGTMRHRRLGYLYLAAMVNLNVAAWSVDTDGVIGPFHVLTVVSLATLVGAYLVILLGRPGRGRSEAHGTMMAWSFAGAVAAGLGQAATVLALPVGATILGSLAVGAVVIHGLRPGALRMPDPGVHGTERREAG